MTQPLGKNYGGMMQAFALQEFLRQEGYKPVTVNRKVDKKNTLHTILKYTKRALLKLMGKYKADVFFESRYPFILENSYDFLREGVELTPSIESTEQLKQYFRTHKFEAIIVGSDQTWRPKYSPNIFNFYLDFLEDKDIKRISYASSFGVDSWEYNNDEASRCSKLIARFDYVSVREVSGVSLCKKYFGIEATPVLDPTLLLSKERYLELLGDRYTGDGDRQVLYCYWLDKSETILSESHKLANQLGYDLNRCQPNLQLNDFSSSNLNDYMMPHPKDWLASFANASLILTDSFHGMVFSIVFNKPFFVLVNKERGAARFLSLLRYLGLENRLIYDITEIHNKQHNLYSELDTDNEELERLKSKSKSFLINALHARR